MAETLSSQSTVTPCDQKRAPLAQLGVAGSPNAGLGLALQTAIAVPACPERRAV